MSLESVAVLREGGRGWHRIDKDKYDADPGAYVRCDETGKPLDALPIEDMAALRTEYQRLVGKRAFHGWDEAELRARMAAHTTEQAR